MVPLTQIKNTGGIDICGKGAELLFRRTKSQVPLDHV